MWRLILTEGVNISYTEAAEMDVETLIEANAALDLYNEAIKKATKKGKKGGK